MDIKEKIKELVEKISKDPKLQAQFRENPVKAVETLLGVSPEGYDGFQALVPASLMHAEGRASAVSAAQP